MLYVNSKYSFDHFYLIHKVTSPFVLVNHASELCGAPPFSWKMQSYDS